MISGCLTLIILSVTAFAILELRRYLTPLHGNIHCNIIKTVDDETWGSVLPVAIREIFELTAKLGGQVSGEHGIGYVQREYIGITRGPTEIALMKQIKAIFDPKGILNPMKIFPSDPA